MTEPETHANGPVSGIYQIRNRHTGRVYIGKSKNIHDRWLAHRSALERGLHINSDLQGDWEIYGAHTFEFTVLEEIAGIKALWNAEARHFTAADDAYNARLIYEVRQGRLTNSSPCTLEQFTEALRAGFEYTIKLPGGLSRCMLTQEDYDAFHDSGYKGLYAGEGAAAIAARKGVAKGKILDHMGSGELAANLFRITLTEQKLTNDPTIDSKSKANRAHRDVGAAVRSVIIEQGGTPPEQLPTPEHSIQELEQEEQRRIQGERQPSLFSDDTGEE
jgi:hypothetical protein